MLDTKIDCVLYVCGIQSYTIRAWNHIITQEHLHIIHVLVASLYVHEELRSIVVNGHIFNRQQVSKQILIAFPFWGVQINYLWVRPLLLSPPHVVGGGGGGLTYVSCLIV